MTSRWAQRAIAPLMLLVLAACGKGEGEQAQAQQAPPPPQVTVASPIVQRLKEWDEFTGRFEAIESVEIRARVAGYLDSVHFEDGALVEAGDLLFVIDPRPYEIASERAKAQIAEADSRLRLADLEADRIGKLVASNNAARSQLDQRVADRQAAEASKAASQASLREAELDLTFSRVTSPIKGRISNRRVDVGNLVGDTTLLTTVVALDPLYIVFDLSEADYLGYQRAAANGSVASNRDKTTPVELHLLDEQGWPHKGTMNFVDNVVDSNTGTVRARALIPNADLLITPGQFGRVRIPGSPEYDAIMVPDTAVVTDQSRKMLMTVAQDGTVAAKIVRLGPTQPGGLRIIRQGIEATDKVIINGLVRARPGGKVAPQEGKIEAQPGLSS